MGKRLSSKLYSAGNGRYVHNCPGCKTLHWVRTHCSTEQGDKWNYTGDAEHPTFSPSVHVWPNTPHACHYFLTDGVLSFCDDTTHELAGKAVPLPDLPQWLGHDDL